MLKNKTLIKRLLISLIKENNDRISKEDLERFCDDEVNAHNLFPSFEGPEGNKKVIWNLEDHAKMNNESFHNTISKISDGNDLINICFSPKCSSCDNELKKLEVTDMKYTMRCYLCSVDYVFEIVHYGKPIVEEI